MSQAGKLVVLKLDGDLADQGFKVTVEITAGGEFPHEEIEGRLPACPELAEDLRQWQHLYRNLGPGFRIRPKGIEYVGLFNQRADFCDLAAQVKSVFLTWLRSESFRSVDQRLRETWRDGENIQVMVRSKDVQVHHLPWHIWDLIDRYAKTEVTFGPTEFKRQPSITAIATDDHPGKVRILAILGHSEGIDTTADRQALAQLPDAEVVFLNEPSRQEISEQLWGTAKASQIPQEPQPSWDILFFAGHSQTDNTTGRIYINPIESLTLEELNFGLRKATERGLKLAIFNSCDGLGLTQTLDTLNLPHMIVMREPVPDPIAQQFLQFFLRAFAGGASLTSATRQAREQLQGLEGEFPCATWLPVIHHHPGVAAPTWQTLRYRTGAPQSLPPLVKGIPVPVEQPSAPLMVALPRRGASWWVTLLGSLAATTLSMGLRSVNILQPLEFYGFDQMVKRLPAETPDQRIVVVEVTRDDIEALGGEYPLQDATLLKLLQTLETHSPKVIGVDIYRDRPEGDGQKDFQAYLNRQNHIVPICVHPDQKDATGVAPPPGINPAQLGFSDVMVDRDGVVRRHLLALDPSSTSPCPAFYSLSAQLALRYLEANGATLAFPQPDQWQLGETQFQILGHPLGVYPDRATTRGHQILLKYRSYNTLEDMAERVSLTQVLAGEVAPEQIQDRVVLIGVSDPTVKDYFRTPHGTEIRGLLLHAQMTSQLISAVTDQRSLLRFWPQWADLLWVYGWSVVALRGMGQSAEIKARSLLVLLGVGGLLAISWGLLWGVSIVVPVVPALVAVVVAGAIGRAQAQPSIIGASETQPMARRNLA